ncbi:anti-sigma factor family protein [Haliangium ochraceum]|uniref:Putative transmembrane anti-sigma factor n=1 Tax=Haliangium ochraceum (strain DSM 14365 / JCM 11303 / SMP-2) TaxID=502025 RepID=D0LGN9_HALO1|nr:zf-HC2 domain-containing protein [Haliangium ochraceum]ACY12785.1 putative transmembrane anti-sigma factor [Haliangium ochraceum DSM 14365]
MSDSATPHPEPHTVPPPEIEAQFSDLHDGSLGADEARALESHLQGCDACRAAYDEFCSAVDALAGMHKMSAPQHFEREVEETIRRRSGGRFFGRKAFGERVPFELIAVVVLVFGLVIFFAIRSSQTGSLRYEQPSEEPAIDPAAADVLLPRM